MKKITILFMLAFASVQLSAQENLSYLLVSGIDDTRAFAGEYVRPGTEAVIHNLSNGWYQTAEVKNVLGFELSVIGNASVNLDEHHTFLLNTGDYENLHFVDGSVEKEVPSILGATAPYEVYAEHEGQQVRFMLPQGLGAAGVEMVPSAFLQARFGIFKGTELKARYLPKIGFSDVDGDLFGGAIQHEFSSWLPGSDVLPVAVSGIVGYTQMRGAYDFGDHGFLEGENQELNAKMQSWLFSAIVSTNIPVINFYGGLGYVAGTSETEMLGTYSVIDENSGQTLVNMEDPFVLSHSANGLRANLGMSLKLGFFKISADYAFQEYQTLSAGVHFGI